MNMLFYAYPGVMSQSPVFNMSWAVIYSELIATLNKAGHRSSKLLCAKRVMPFLGEKIPASQISSVEEIALHREVAQTDPAFSGATALFQAAHNANDDQSPPVKVLLRHIARAVGDFKPDIILTFAMGANYLKSLWPEARIICVESGAFSRPPFPHSLIFDPIGIYEKSLLGRHGKALFETVQPEMLKLAVRFRDATLEKLKKQNPFLINNFEGKFEKLALLPLQVSNYVSFDGQSPYRSQFEYLFDIAAQTPSEVGLIVTEYVQWGEVVTTTLPRANLSFLIDNFPNLILDPRFRKYTNTSQFIVPMVDGVWSVSSTIGVQAALFGKQMGSPLGSQNAPIASAHTPADFFAKLNTPASVDRTPELAWYLCHYSVPDKLLNDGEWLFNYLVSLKADEHAGTQPLSSADTLTAAWLDSLTDQRPNEWRSTNNTHFRQICEKDLQLARSEAHAAANAQYLQRRSRSKQSSFILLNDTRQIDKYTHLGCNAVTHFIIEEASKLGLTWHGSASTLAECEQLEAEEGFENVSLVILNGEGTMHHDSPRGRELMEFCSAMKNRDVSCVLVNSVWHENTDILGSYLDLFDIVTVRESRSLSEIRKFRPDTRLVPDFTFAAFKSTAQHFDSSSFGKTAGAKVCVTDSVDCYTAEQLREFSEINALPFFLMGGVQAALTSHEHTVFAVGGVHYPRVLRDLSELEGAELCLTGRFHGLIAALMKGIPTFALPSNTPKVEGLLADIGIADLALLGPSWLKLTNAERLADLEERASRWEANAAKRVSAYVTSAEGEILQLFNEIEPRSRHARRKAGWVIRMREALSYPTAAMKR
jgi:hypothetical protein